MTTIPIDRDAPLTAQLRAHGIEERTRRYGQWWLYRFHDEGGCLLYVGITNNPTQRWTSHRRTADWWPFVDRVDLVEMDAEWRALDAERAAIRTEMPIYNRRSSIADSAHDCGTTVEQRHTSSASARIGNGREEEGKRKGSSAGPWSVVVVGTNSSSSRSVRAGRSR